MKISIVIPTCDNYEENLKVCIDNILKNTDIEDKEIIIVANGSNKEIIPYVESLGNNFRLIWHDNKIGVTSAFNVGCREAKGEFIVLMNDDLILLGQPKNEWIGRLLAPFVDEKMGITGSITRDASTNIEFVISYCTMIRSKLFDAIGYFDEIFDPYYGEDIDFNMRAKIAGWKIGYANMNIYHPYENDATQKPELKAIIKEKIEILKKRYLGEK